MFGEKIPAFNTEASGIYVCSRCGGALFAAHQQFDAGCGFPSFWRHLQNGVAQNPLDTYGRNRIQLLCSNCGLHLGHLFCNKHTPTGLRYCINKTSIQLQDPSFKDKTMSDNNQHFNDLKEWIKTQRSNESNFEAVYQKLEKEHAFALQQNNAEYAASLLEIIDKQAAEYRNAKESAGTAWPEYEKLITAWERAISAASDGAS